MRAKSDVLSDLVQIIDYEFRTFGNYLGESNSMFSRQIAELESDVKKCQLSMGDLLKEGGGEIDPSSPAFSKWEDLRSDEYMSGLHLTALNDMRRVFTSSSFTFVASIFEGSLKRICGVFVNPSKLGPQHLKGPSYTVQAQLFLSRVVGIELPESSKWDNLRKFVHIRNSIIHENAVVEKKRGKSLEGQSDKYRSIMSVKEFLVITESEDALSFTIEDISLIDKFSEVALSVLMEITEKSIAHARMTNL